jgi:N-methylhydantoinase A
LSTDALRTQGAKPMGRSVPEAAWGVHATVNENMANAARVHAVERGQDTARLPMLVFGGNGPVHGPGVAEALGSDTVVVPPAAGVLSALGFLAAPLSIDFVHSWHTELSAVTTEDAATVLDGLAAQGEQVLCESGVAAGDIVFSRSLEMRFVGQGNEIEVPVPAPGDGWETSVQQAFAEQYRERFGAVAPRHVDAEIISWRVTARGPEPDARLRLSAPDAHSVTSVGERAAYFPQAEGYVQTPVYDRYRLPPDAQVNGPALVEEDESTLVLAPGMTGTVSKDGSIVVRLRPEGGVP